MSMILFSILERGFLRALEGIAANDAAVGAAVTDTTDFLEHAVQIFRLAAGEHHDALPLNAHCMTCSTRFASVEPSIFS